MSSTITTSPHLDVESAVMQRYSKGSKAQSTDLCCPVSYDSKYLEAIPQEVIECDYGCGDPSQYVREGDTVLDLGSGAGKICYIASQIVGPTGRVIGIDFNSDMLALARKHQPGIARQLGFDNVAFRRGRIQDLAIDLESLDRHLSQKPISTANDLLALDDRAERLRHETPLVASETIDIVLSNCVLNLVKNSDKRKMFEEIYRVLKVGGRAAISDIVSDEPIPEAMQNDPELWSGCISGALSEQAFIQAFIDAGFYGVALVKRDEKPWRIVNGIEFRSVTVQAHKGKEGPCYEHNQAVMYKGPFCETRDDDGHTYRRGERVAVCEKTFRLLNREPYRDQFYFIEPNPPVDPARVKPFDCSRTAPRHPRETKGQDYDLTTEASTCCGPDGTC